MVGSLSDPHGGSASLKARVADPPPSSQLGIAVRSLSGEPPQPGTKRDSAIT